MSRRANPAGTAIRVRRILHTIHAVRDVHPLRKIYQDVFGAIAFAERYHEGEDRDMALLYAADHMIELMAPRRAEPDTTFARYLHRFGESFHSFELRVENAPAAAELCEARGLALSTVYPLFFFVKPQSTGGVLIQFCGKPLENDPQDYHNWNPDWIEGHPSSLRRLRHIACFVRDREAALRFFTEVVNGQLLSDEHVEMPQQGRRAGVMLGDTKVALFSADDPTSGVFADYFTKPRSGIFALVWEVDNLTAARAHIEERGHVTGPSLLDPDGFAISQDSFYGARHEFVRDS
jgi:catechol 2,3-dioxygenase-like lactoylglutathione lyase family enzyme